MAPKLPIPGGCNCGEVRYLVTKPPLAAYICHCHLCQKRTGSAFQHVDRDSCRRVRIGGRQSDEERTTRRGRNEECLAGLRIVLLAPQYAKGRRSDAERSRGNARRHQLAQAGRADLDVERAAVGVWFATTLSLTKSSRPTLPQSLRRRRRLLRAIEGRGGIRQMAQHVDVETNCGKIRGTVDNAHQRFQRHPVC